MAVPSADPCSRPSLVDLNALAGEAAIACAVDPWLLGLQRGTEAIPVGRRPGAVFVAQANGLRGVSVWLDTPAGEIEGALFEVGADGTSLGPELARAQAVGTDEYGLTAFTFDPVSDSAGRRFAFVLSCSDCAESRTHAFSATADDGDGNLIDDGRLRTDRVAVQTPIYDRVPPASAPATRVAATGRGPGVWTIEVDAPNPALLVVAETWFPGWKATVDGKSTPVVQADGAFLGVAMGAGRHVVQFTYHRPVAADVGRVITFGTLLGLAGAGWWRRRNRSLDEGARVGQAEDEGEEAVAGAPPPPGAGGSAAARAAVARGAAGADRDRRDRPPGGADTPGEPSAAPDPPDAAIRSPEPRRARPSPSGSAQPGPRRGSGPPARPRPGRPGPRRPPEDPPTGDHR